MACRQINRKAAAMEKLPVKESKYIPQQEDKEKPTKLSDKISPLKIKEEKPVNGEGNGEAKNNHTLSEAARLHIALKVMDTEARAKYYALVNHCEENNIDINSAPNGRFKDILEDEFAVMAEEMTISDAPGDAGDPAAVVRNALETITPANTEQKANEIIQSLLSMAVDITKRKTYKEEWYKLPDAEALGKAIAIYFGKDEEIFQAFVRALKDADFHDEACQISLRHSTRFHHPSRF